jgi:hypothetical protein
MGLMTFYEMIDRLIDVTEVPENKHSGEGYESARRLIHEELTNVKDVDVGCHHEAAHWSEAVLAANQLGVDVSLFKVVGPRITYDASRDAYEPTPTGLKMIGMEGWKAQTEEEVKILARIAVAGGESVHHFYGPNQKRGDGNDIGRFNELCREARMRLGSIIQAPPIYINEARDSVRADFENERFRETVRLKAQMIKKEQFRLESDM